MDKVVATAVEAVADVPDGASEAVGGCGLSGVPNVPVQALDVLEADEAFAAQVLGRPAEWPEFALVLERKEASGTP
ncbi:hypothetical protein ABZ484_21175 [Streptomyces sp. NPDC006393]|uniref:hypothetical protein n=1 Tax=Streptomyces sp. NPDC006393 TaxID=3156763 RepID=UPI0033D776D8